MNNVEQIQWEQSYTFVCLSVSDLFYGNLIYYSFKSLLFFYINTEHNNKIMFKILSSIALLHLTLTSDPDGEDTAELKAKTSFNNR